MALYERLAATASRLVERFGSPITLTKSTRAEYDPTAGEFLDSSARTYTGYGVRTEYRANEIDGTRIQSGDARVYLSIVVGAQPATGDVLTIEGARYAVLECRPLQPGPVVVLYDVQARKP